MPWARFEAAMPRNPKVNRLTDAEFRSFVEATCWSVEHLTDGWIGLEDLGSAIPSCGANFRRKRAQVLTDRGLWIEEDGGWRINDFAEYQPSKEQVERDRTLSRHRQQKYRDRKAKVTLTSEVAPMTGEELFIQSGKRAAASSETAVEPSPNVTLWNLLARRSDIAREVRKGRNWRGFDDKISAHPDMGAEQWLEVFEIYSKLISGGATKVYPATPGTFSAAISDVRQRMAAETVHRQAAPSRVLTYLQGLTEPGGGEGMMPDWWAREYEYGPGSQPPADKRSIIAAKHHFLRREGPVEASEIRRWIEDYDRQHNPKAAEVG